MQEGTNTIYVKVRTGNTWSEKKKLLATKDTILNLEMLSNNGQVTVYYSDGSNNYSVEVMSITKKNSFFFGDTAVVISTFVCYCFILLDGYNLGRNNARTRRKNSF